MKRFVCFALSLLFVCTITASCGENKPEATETATVTTETEVSTDKAETADATDTEEPAPLTPEEKLKDKTALFVGDALFAGVSSEDNVSDGIVSRTASKFAFKTVKNAAEDGASVSDIPGKPTVYSQLEAESNNKYDFVIIEGGVTDAAAAVDIGRIVPEKADETDESELDTKKFAGGFEKTLMTAKKLFPDASVGCFIAPEIKSGVGAVSDMRRFAEVMRLACEKWGVFVLDASGNNDIKIEYNKNTGRTASTNLSVYEGNGPENAIDGDTSTLFWAYGGAYDGSTFTVDLSVLSDVSSVNLIMGSEKYQNNYMHSALMEYSADGEEYTKLCDLNKTNRITYCDTKFTARYVRVRSTAYDVEWPLITEFEIEAEPSKDAGGEYEKPVRISGADLEKLTALISEFMGEIYSNKREPVFETKAGLCGVASVLSGKKVLYYGDSVCDKSFHDDPARTTYYSYAGRISELYGTKTYNRGRNSASFSTARGTNTIINQTKTDLNRKVDMIVIEGGVNDAMDSAPVGAVSDMTSENFDTDKLDKKTMAGGLEEVLYTLKENHPEAVIVYMILYKVDFSMGRCNDMDEYVDTIKALCDKWGVEYLDLYNDVWFNIKFNTKSRVYTNDGLHPNAAGYDFLTPVLAEFMADAYVKSKGT